MSPLTTISILIIMIIMKLGKQFHYNLDYNSPHLSICFYSLDYSVV